MSVAQHQTDQRIKGWAWVCSSLRAAATQARAEADRLLGPDRGE